MTPSITPTITDTPTSTPTPTITDTPTSTPTNTPTLTNTPTPTNTVTPSSTITPTPTITPTSTLTPTPTITPTSTNTLNCKIIRNNSNKLYQYDYLTNINSFLYDTGTGDTVDIAMTNNKLYTLSTSPTYGDYVEINEFNFDSTLFLVGNLLNTWRFSGDTYPDLPYSQGLEIRDSNNIFLAGNTIYQLTITNGLITPIFTLPDLFDTEHPSFVIGDMLYNSATQNIIILYYTTPYNAYYIGIFDMNGNKIKQQELNNNSGYLGGTFNYQNVDYDIKPASLFVNNNNLYMITDWGSYVYSVNINTLHAQLEKTITNDIDYTYTSGVAQIPECININF